MVLVIAMVAKHGNLEMANKKVEGGICLYGPHSGKTGWLAYAGEMKDHNFVGDGVPVDGKGATESVFEACAALEKLGVTGLVWVYAPCGKKKSLENVRKPSYYGNMKWVDAEVYLISAEEIERAACECCGGEGVIDRDATVGCASGHSVTAAVVRVCGECDGSGLVG